ncbi:MAG: hypothetical protein JW697_07085 [Kosmotogaceae bacterium]|nr:hypothetical protein [Kosmotogaceae bacterium]
MLEFCNEACRQNAENVLSIMLERVLMGNVDEPEYVRNVLMHCLGAGAKPEMKDNLLFRWASVEDSGVDSVSVFLSRFRKDRIRFLEKMLANRSIPRKYRKMAAKELCVDAGEMEIAFIEKMGVFEDHWCCGKRQKRIIDPHYETINKLRGIRDVEEFNEKMESISDGFEVGELAVEKRNGRIERELLVFGGVKLETPAENSVLEFCRCAVRIEESRVLRWLVRWAGEDLDRRRIVYGCLFGSGNTMAEKMLDEWSNGVENGVDEISVLLLLRREDGKRKSILKKMIGNDNIGEKIRHMAAVALYRIGNADDRRTVEEGMKSVFLREQRRIEEIEEREEKKEEMEKLKAEEGEKIIRIINEVESGMRVD